LIWIVIEWIVWLWETNNRDNLDIILNEKDKKMQYFSTAKINNKTLINYAKKKATILCRWKWDSYTVNDTVVCRTNGWAINADWKTYIIKNWHVNIAPASTAAWKNYNVFVMNWDLVINEASTNAKFIFNTDGFVWSGVDPSYQNPEPAIASLIKWNFIVNWKIKWTWTWGKLYDKYFIYWKLTTTDTFNTLLDTFQWRCNNWVSTTESNGAVRPCPSEIGWWENPYAGASLVVIDQNYDSVLYNS
jgi:hypothetical protein